MAKDTMARDTMRLMQKGRSLLNYKKHEKIIVEQPRQSNNTQ